MATPNRSSGSDEPLHFRAANVTTLKTRPTDYPRALDQMTEKLKPENNLLIFYAGHGQWDEQREQGYWLPRDAMRERRATGFPGQRLRDATRGIKARHILWISDAASRAGFPGARGLGPRVERRRRLEFCQAGRR